ncbi:hypothetical protein ON010_g16034 [Phytophthora cinnamomi]|nr:hypothetical protein ON010_g16034 [Phytophthora cinnamomi]
MTRVESVLQLLAPLSSTRSSAGSSLSAARRHARACLNSNATDDKAGHMEIAVTSQERAPCSQRWLPKASGGGS